MGNQSSRGAPTHPPPNWTQSFPRENKRLKKYGATTDTKVLPQRIPGQRLRPTENGHHLQANGTLTGRRMSEFQVPHHPAFPPSMPLHQPHSSSMTALHHPQYPDARAASMHDLRFGRPPSKSYASEPDLRGPSPSMPLAPPPHTIISQSPTKGRIKSKKKNKAPPVPPGGMNNTHSLPRPAERSHSVGSMIPHAPQQPYPAPWGVHFAEQPTSSELQKPKSRKMGLFRKKNESRRAGQEEQWNSGEDRGRDRDRGEEKRGAASPVRYSPREELRERARSLDCLQHELRHPPVSPVPTAATSLTHLHQPSEPRLWATLERESRRSSRHEVDPKRSSTIERESRRTARESKNTLTLEKDAQKSHRRMSTLERKVEERKHSQDVRDNSTPLSSTRVSRIDSYRDNSSHRRSSSSGSHHDLIPEENEKRHNEWNKQVNAEKKTGKSTNTKIVEDEWEKAETNVVQRKKMSANLQAELIQTVKNLKKAPVEEPKQSTLNRKKKESEKQLSPKPSSHTEIVNEQSESQPKTFFFGMEPSLSRDSCRAASGNSGLHKIMNQEEAAKMKNQEEVHINGLTVEYTRRTLERADKSRSRTRASGKDKKRESELHKESDAQGASKHTDHRKLTKDVEDFAVAIERHKLSHIDGESGGSSSSRREDGGYHSRQNSGSLYLENEQDLRDENELSMNLRPILPRRQLEIPRFSPNAAWRSLSLERASRQAETLDETRSSEGPDSVFEARIQRFTRPTAPPRGSGEKSADSGISGDAGSPGPNHEFEPLVPTEKSKSSSGPLAVSSPVASGRIEGRRAWTPAQDLDENSLDSNAEPTALPTGLSTPPKLTSRTNMFPRSKDVSPEREDEVEYPETEPISELISPEKRDYWSRRKKRNSVDGTPQKFNSLRKLKRTVSGAINGMGYKSPVPEDYEGSRTPEEPSAQPQDDSNWRDNWSMSRSIPTSLNTCEEHDTASNLSSTRNIRSRSESRLGGVNGIEIPPEDSRSRTPSYLQYGNNGHIMYLPEYNSRRISQGEGDSEDESERHFRRGGQHHSSRQSVHPRTPDHERKPPSGDENPSSPETNHGPTSLPPSLLHQAPPSRRLRGKKFSYQSTVRVLEMRKLEEKLSREVAEKEKHRLKETEAMKKVEEEFQRKREREKKKVKQQLKLFQMQQKQQKHAQPPQSHGVGRDSHNTSYSSDDHAHSTYSSEQHEVSSQSSSHPPPLPSSPPPEVFPSFTSLPPELPSDGSPGFMSGLKSWVRNRKESRSSSSSVTLTSAPRQEPDGAPASSPRKISDDFSSTGTNSAGNVSDHNDQRKQDIRSEIIAASRKRSGDYSHMINHRASGRANNPRKSIYNHLQEVAQQESQRAQSHHQDSNYHHRKHKKVSKDELRRSQSPENRHVGSPMMQELSELHQERREYREYRSPSRHSHSPTIRNTTILPGPPAPIGPSKNYRRDFCRGNAQVIGLNVVSVKGSRNDESDRHSKHSNDERRSVGSSGGVGRSTSMDLLDASPSPHPPARHPRRHPHPHDSPHAHNPARMSPPVISSPARFAHSILTPFNPVKGYRPVSFSPPPPTKILHVN